MTSASNENILNIEFADEPETELISRKNLYLSPISDLSILLSNIQDRIEKNGINVDRSTYKYIHGKLCKFSIDLISTPDIPSLIRRSNSIKKLKLIPTKLKWEFSSDNRTFILKIGKVQDHEIFINVAFIDRELTDELKLKIKTWKDDVINGKENEEIEVLKPSSNKKQKNNVEFDDNITIHNPPEENDNEEENEIVDNIIFNDNQILEIPKKSILKQSLENDIQPRIVPSHPQRIPIIRTTSIPSLPKVQQVTNKKIMLTKDQLLELQRNKGVNEAFTRTNEERINSDKRTVNVLNKLPSSSQIIKQNPIQNKPESKIIQNNGVLQNKPPLIKSYSGSFRIRE